jgi:hypothetical protein
MTELEAIVATVAFLLALGTILAVCLVATALVYELRDRYRRRGHGGYVVIRPRVDDSPMGQVVYPLEMARSRRENRRGDAA